MIRHLVRVARAALHEAAKRRSPKWRKVEKDHLEAEPLCAGCGGTKRLQVHHVEPFNLDPALELDPANLETLCMGDQECHLLLGHGGSFDTFNHNLMADLVELRLYPKRRPMILARAKTSRLPLTTARS